MTKARLFSLFTSVACVVFAACNAGVTGVTGGNDAPVSLIDANPHAPDSAPGSPDAAPGSADASPSSADAIPADIDAGITIPNSCGDEVCSTGETCSSCAGDCGPCPTGTFYYVSNDGNDNNDGKSPATAWATLSKVEQAGSHNSIIAAGDSILFRKGDTFVGTLKWDRYYGGTSPTGTATAPITFASYGSGAKPVFEYPPITANSPAVADRILMEFFGIDYLVFDGLDFTDPTIADGDKTTLANQGISINLGSFNESNDDNCIVQNSDFFKVGLGVVIDGSFNVVDHCTFVDLKDLVDTTCATPGDTGMCSYDDYGANGITFSGNDNLFTHNYFSGNWAHSADFEFNGGAIEAYGGTIGLSRNRILYNTIIDGNGVMEIGSSGEATSDDNLLAYNLMINNGLLTWVSVTGVFATDTSNVQYFNNTVIENSASRFHDGMELGASAAGAAPTLFNFRNNIFVLSDGANVLNGNAVISKFAHSNNIFELSGGGVTHFTPDATDVSTAVPLFDDMTETDATQWDYRLLPGTPAIGGGTNVSLTQDFNGNPVGSTPDIGAFQSQ